MKMVKKNIVVLLVLFLLVCSVSVSALPTMIANWQLDGYLNDLSGNANTLFSSGISYSDAAIVGKSLTLSGANYAYKNNFNLNGYFGTANPNDLFGVSAWFRQDAASVSNYEYIFNYDNFRLYLKNDAGGIYIAGEVKLAGESSFTPIKYYFTSPLGTGWHHVVLSKEQSISTLSVDNLLTLYIDGTFIQSISLPSAKLYTPLSGTTRILYVGSASSSTLVKYSGNLDVITIYNGPVSSTDVTTLYSVKMDGDNDGYRDSKITIYPGKDCVDSDPLINPGMTESCTTVYDDNCNGIVNEGCVGRINVHLYDDTISVNHDGISLELWNMVLTQKIGSGLWKLKNEA